jgi:hypothetical protein
MNSITTELDHIVVAANSLDEGRHWAREVLGVSPEGGGKHDGIATHNTLIKLDGQRYLEIIAIDPEAGAPLFPRWFGLDTQEVRALIAHEPRLVAWVARCSGAADAIERLAASPGYDGRVVRPASRGEFRWRFSFTADGRRISGGVMPHLIQWDCIPHPCDLLSDSGVALSSLTLGAMVPERAVAMLEMLAFADPAVQVGQSSSAQLVATLRTAKGTVVLD